MARYTGPKDRLSRREGFDLFGSGAKLTRIMVPPGQHGPKGVRKRSEFGRQLREKQKTKRIYGVLERQFKRYVARARKVRGNTGETLLTLLERRLDNIVYRLGFAPTRNSARQLVSHGHVKVNGVRVTIPSFEIDIGDTIELSARAAGIPPVAKLLSGKPSLPDWLERKAIVGKVLRLPTRADIVEPIVEQDIVEFYSR